MCSLLLGLLSGSFALGTLLLDVLGEEGLVLLLALLGGLEAVLGVLLDGALSAESLLGDEALDLWRLVEGLVLALDLSLHDVLADVVLLLVESELLDNVISSLHTESVGTLDVSDTLDLLVALLDNPEEEGGDLGADDAAADGLAVTLTLSGWSEAGSAYNENPLLVC